MCQHHQVRQARAHEVQAEISLQDSQINPLITSKDGILTTLVKQNFLILGKSQPPLLPRTLCG